MNEELFQILNKVVQNRILNTFVFCFSKTPLVLFDCQFKDNDWIYSQDDLGKVIKHLQDEWLSHQTKANVVKSMIDSSFQTYMDKFKDVVDENTEKTGNKCIRTLVQPYASLQGKSQTQVHIKFKDRKQVKSLESRVDHYVKKRRLDSEVYEKINEANTLAHTYNIYKPNRTASTDDQNVADIDANKVLEKIEEADSV